MAQTIKMSGNHIPAPLRGTSITRPSLLSPSLHARQFPAYHDSSLVPQVVVDRVSDGRILNVQGLSEPSILDGDTPIKVIFNEREDGSAVDKAAFGQNDGLLQRVIDKAARNPWSVVWSNISPELEGDYLLGPTEESLVSPSERRAMIGGQVVAAGTFNGQSESMGREMRDALKWYYSPLAGIKGWISSTLHSIAGTKEESLASPRARRAMIGGQIGPKDILKGQWESMGREMRDAMKWYYSPLAGFRGWISSALNSIAETIRRR